MRGLMSDFGYDPYNTAGWRVAFAIKLLINEEYGRHVMKQRDEIEQPTSCLNKSEPDEPIFVLCARDPHAAGAVEHWAQQAEQTGLHSPAKILEARGLAAQMREWRGARFSGEHAERAAQAEAANRGDPDRIAEGAGAYALEPAAAMEAFRKREERRQYRMTVAMTAGSTSLATMIRENDGEPLSDAQLRAVAISARKFADMLTVEIIDNESA